MERTFRDAWLPPAVLLVRGNIMLLLGHLSQLQVQERIEICLRTSCPLCGLARVSWTPNHGMAGTKNPAHGRVFVFLGSGGVICAVPTVPKRVRLK